MPTLDDLLDEADRLRLLGTDVMPEGSQPRFQRPAGQLSERTLGLYAADEKNFRRWLARHHPQAPRWPAPEIVAHYLLHQFETDGLSTKTISRRASGLAHAYREAGQADHLRRHHLIAKVLREIIDADAHPDRRPTPVVSPDQLRAVIPPDTATLPIDIRDRAILLTTFVSGLRPRQLEALNVPDVEHAPEGLILHATRLHLTDIPEPIGIRHAKDDLDLCPVKALTAWLALVHDDTGPLFRATTRAPDRSIHQTRLRATDIAKIGPARARAAHVPDPKTYSMFAMTRWRAAAITAVDRGIQATTQLSTAQLAAYRRSAGPFNLSPPLL